MKLHAKRIIFMIMGIILPAMASLAQTPVVSVSPSTIEESSGLCNDTIGVPLQIQNNGTGPLFYNILQVSNFYENFEDGLSKWIISSHWALQSPGYEGNNFLTESPGGDYGNGWNDYIILKDSLVIALKDSARLSFYLKYSLECNYDYFYCQISVNNGGWQNLQVFNCPSTGWTLREYDLSSYVNEGDFIKIRYYFHSDGSVIYDGVGIDEVTIKGVGNIVPWVIFPVTSGVVMPGLSETIQVLISTSGLITGIHLHDIYIITNDPAAPQVIIPVTLNFTGYPVLGPAATSHDFGSCFVHAFNVDTLLIHNTGCDTLIITDITTSASQFQVLQAQFNVLPGHSAPVKVRFEPDAVGVFNGDLFISCNDVTVDPAQPVMQLTGTGLPTPQIEITPQNLEETVLCGDSVMVNLVIHNTGQADLTYSLSSFLSDGLILFYPLDGNAMDLSEFERHGTVVEAVPTTDRLGNINNALEFDGTNDYVDIPDGVYFNGDFTVNAWVYETAYKNWSRLFDFGNGSASDNVLGVMSRGTTGYYTAEIFNGYYSGGQIYEYSSLPLNQWLMITQVQEGINTRIYLNGNLLKSGNSSYTPVDVTRVNNYLARSAWTQDDYYRGKIDDFRIYDRALSVQEISDIYSAQSSLWLSLDSPSGIITPGDSAIIHVKLTATQLLAGDYQSMIKVITNDPVNPEVTVPVYFHVYGYPQIVTDIPSLDFDSTLQHVAVNLPLKVYNTGCDTLFITSFDFSEPVFSVTVPDFPLYILPYDSITAMLQFLSQDTGTFNATLTIVNDAGNLEIYLTGVATGASLIAFSPDTSFAFIQDCNYSLQVSGTISNNGLIDLNWTANNQNGSGQALSFDAYGEWVEIGDFGPMPDQGTIEFWMWTNLWQSYNNVFCTNGINYANYGIRFEEYGSGQFLAIIGNDAGDYTGYTLTYSIETNMWHHVAVSWDKTVNQIWFYLDGDEVISGDYCPTWATNWTDLIIGAGYNTGRWWNGKVDEFRIWNYRKPYEEILATMNWSMTGSESGLLAYWNFDEGTGNQLTDRTNNGHNGTFSGAEWVESGIPISSFVTVEPNSGILPPGESQEVTFSFGTTNMVSGHYSSYIPFYSNDPLHTIILHPCIMEIAGAPEMSTATPEIHFGEIMVEASQIQNMVFYNTGCDTLFIDSASYSYTNEFHFETLPLMVLPFDSAIISVRFSPQNTAYYENWTTFHSNAGALDIFIDGTGIDAPQFAYDPPVLEAWVSCIDTVYIPLTIYNNGLAELYVNIEGSEAGGGSVPVPAECTPYTSNYCCAMGIYHFMLNTIDTLTNDASEGCQDYTASLSTVLSPGETYPIEIQTGPNYSENVSVWIDYNNNGSFEEDENVLSSYYGPYHTGNITIPLNAFMNVPLRLRVAADYYNNGMPTACSNPYYSQDEDYTVIIISGIYPPLVQDTIPAMSNEIYNVMFTGSDLNSGDYSNFISITTNDPVNPQVSVPCLLHVSGDAQFTLAENYHDYGFIMINTVDYYNFPLENNGCDTLVINNYYPTHSAFNVVLDDSILYPGEFTVIHVTFAPLEVNYFECDVWFNTNIGDYNIFMVAYGTPAPSIIYTPDTFNLTLDCGSSTEIPLSIFNDGEAVLHYEVNVHPELDSGLMVYYPFYGNVNDFSGNNRNLSNQGAQLTEGNTGLLNNAYSFENEAIITYDNTADIPNLYSTNMSVSLWVKFPDPSYWQSSTPVVWSLSGYQYNYDGVLIQADPYNIYGKFRVNYNYYEISCPIQIDTWMHLSYTYDGHVIRGYVNGVLCSEYAIEGTMYYYTNTPAFILGNWNNPEYDAQYFTGKIDDFRYYNRTLTPEEIAALAANVSHLIHIEPNPVNDSVGAYDWHDVILSVYTDNLVAGIYQDFIDISSDDPLHPHQYIPVNLEIIGTPQISVTPDCLEYDTIMQFTNQTLEALIENPGCTTLFVSSLYTATSSFSPAFPNVVIPPFGSNTVPVIFNPVNEGLNEDTLYIDSEAGFYKVCLRGYCTGIPVAVVSPTSINQVLSCDESITLSLQLRNEGLSAMTYHINAPAAIWFSGINTTGTLDPGGETSIEFILSRTNVPTGLFNQVIPVVTNDPLHGLINVPMYLLIPNPLIPVHLGSDTGYCIGSTYIIHAGNYASYLWNDGSTGSTLSVSNPGTYWVDVIDNHGCTSSDTMVLTEYPIPTALAGNDTTVCQATTIYLHGNSENTIPPFPLEIKIGNGTQYSVNTGPDPFGTYFMDHRAQYLYKHSELIEAGLRAGNITALGFVLNGVGSPGMNNFNIRIKNTTSNTLSGFASGFTEVFHLDYYYPVVGQNVFTLDLPFFWNGSTGIIVEVCFDNNGWVSNSSYEFTATQGCVIGAYCDNCAPGCFLTGGQAYSERPNLLIHGDGDLTIYHWTGPSGFVSNLRNPIINNAALANAGTYSLTVNNGIGCTDTDELTVIVEAMPVVDAGPDGSILGGETFQFNPVITGGTSPYSYYWSPSLYLNDSSLLNAITSPVFTTTYTLNVTGNNGCYNKDQTVVTVVPRFALSGHVTYDNYLYSALPDVKINVRHSSGIPYDSTYTDESGNYLFPYLIEGNYTVTAQADLPTGSINATDALKIGKHVVALENLTGRSLKSADVNASNTVTGADALLVLHHTVGNITTFPAGDWYFETKTITISGSDKTQDFLGVCYGDVNLSYIPGLKEEPSLLQETNGIVCVARDQEFYLPIRIKNAMVLGALTLNLIIPQQYFLFEDVILPEGTAVVRLENNVLHLAWSNTASIHLNPEDILIQLKMRRTSLSPPNDTGIKIYGSHELADVTGNIIGYQTLLIPKILEAEVYPDGFYLSQNQPNPFDHSSVIPYYLPEQGQIVLEIFNVMGESVLIFNEGNEQEGQHSIYLSANDLPCGIYYYTMTYQSVKHYLRQTRSMIISK